MTHAQRMAEIKDRDAAATAGPWYSGDDPGRDCPGCDEIEYYFAIVGTGSGGIPAVATIEYDDRQSGNREFIAHSRADIPYLISRVETLEAALRDAVEAIPDAWLMGSEDPTPFDKTPYFTTYERLAAELESTQ